MIQHKIDYSIALMQKAEKMALAYHPDGFRLAFSGGKDSIVMYRLAQMAGVKFVPHMEVTTLDHPELMKYVRFHYPDVTLNRPKINFYDLIKKKKMLPLRQSRFCCAYLKEQSGAGTCTLIGIRADESARRAGRNEVEISNHKYSNTLDQFNIDAESKHLCIKGKDKLLISPIFHWTNRDVWIFIRQNKMPYCKLYDEGYTRVGCIFCPMASRKSKNRDRLRYPKVERAIKKSIQYLIDTDGYGNRHNANADEIFDWWCSNQSYDMYFLNLRIQRKIEFEF
jgi:phosphoadenosine phosphosulfate reductase